VAVLAPIIVNILFFHILMAPAGLPLALVVTILWMLVAWKVRPALQGIFQK